jgi:hypothetical protein
MTADNVPRRVIHYPTPENDAEAAALVRRLEAALAGLQLGEAERMAYELVRFHWRREGCRLELAYAVLDGIATRNVGAALAECERLRQLFAPAGRLAA